MAHEHTIVNTDLESVFHWDYSVKFPQMDRLYENAKRDQWNVSTTINWDRPIENEVLDMTMMPMFQTELYQSLSEENKLSARAQVRGMAAVAVPARRAGRADGLRTVGRRGARPRRQDERGGAGVRRGAPRRRLPQVHHQARSHLPDRSRRSSACCRRDGARSMGAQVRRDADRRRGPRDRGVPLHAARDQGRAAEGTARVHHEGRGAPRRLRDARAARRGAPSSRARTRRTSRTSPSPHAT